MEAFHQQIAAAAHKTSIAGSTVSVAGWATSSDLGMWAGIVIGIAGLVVNWYFKRQADKRNQESHNLYMAQLKRAQTLRQLDPKEDHE